MMTARRERSLFAFSQALLFAIEGIYHELDPKARKRVCTRLLVMEETIASEPGDDLRYGSDVAGHLHYIMKTLMGDLISELPSK
jgi:uncharacterized protein YjeT (DUF2065 family)